MSAVLIRTQAEEKFQEAKQAVDLSQAPLIVAVGRGIKSQENIELVKKLAEAMVPRSPRRGPFATTMASYGPPDRQLRSNGFA
jgi:electron transfer flavoprotein alpha subunit